MRVWLNLREDGAARASRRPTSRQRHRRRRTTSTRRARSARSRRPAGQSLVYTVTARGRLDEPDDFGNIVLRSSGPNGALRIRDVARVELGAVSYDAFTNLDGKPTVGIAVYLQSGGNALKVARHGARRHRPDRRRAFRRA